MNKQYEFNNLDMLKDFKLEIILPEIKNGRYIENIYEKIIKEVKIQVFINDNLYKEYMQNNIDFSNNNLDYLYDIQNYKILLLMIIDTYLDNMCIWNLEYPPHICGELIIN